MSAANSIDTVNGELAPFEAAARLYCQKAGIDPDRQMAVPHPLGLAIPHHVPQWELAAVDLVDLSRKLTAMREAATTQIKVN